MSTAKHTIYRDLRRDIIMGHIKSGERLHIAGLARRYDTSVTPVRDALQMLGQEGLVTIRPRSGYFVTRTTLKQLRDMLDLRKVLELAAVERSALRVGEEQIAELRAVHAGYSGDDDYSYERYTDENRRFHYLLAQASGNHELADALGRLLDRLARFMVIRRAGKFQAASHERIIAALESHDAALARQAILEEIDATSTAILDEVLQEEASGWHVDGYNPRGE